MSSSDQMTAQDSQNECVGNHQSEEFHEQCQKLYNSGFQNDELNKFWLGKHDGDIYKTLVSLQDVMQYYM